MLRVNSFYINEEKRYREYAGLEIPIVHRVTVFTANSDNKINGGPTSALKSMRTKQSFRCHVLNIAPMYKQKARKKSGGVIIFTLRSPDRTGGGGGGSGVTKGRI